MNSAHYVLFHTFVRWLLKGNVLNRVFVDEMKLFSELKAKKF